MKLNRFFSVLLVALLTACGGGGDREGSGEESSGSATPASELPDVLTRATTQLDLSEYFMPFELYVPDSTRGVPMIEETSFGEVSVHVGKTYHIIIAEGGDLAMKKADLEGDLTFTHEIVEEGADYILYKSTIKDSYLEPEFHFYAVKQVGGTSYEFHDYSDEGGYAQTVAAFMLESVKHLQPKEKQQSS